MRCFLESVLPHRIAKLIEIGVKDNREIMRCPDCGLITCAVVGEEQYLKLYKEDTRYFDLVGAGYAGFEDRFLHDYAISETRFGNLMRHSVGARTLLDVGTGNGAFLRRGVEAGFECCGVDLNKWMLDRARALVPAGLFRHGEIMELEFDNQFDIITFIDVFEHLLNPLEAAQRIDELLSPGGLVVVETPDTDSDDWKSQQLEWAHCKPFEHPFLYNDKHIRAIFGTIGLEMIDKIFTIPGRCTCYLRRGAKK